MRSNLELRSTSSHFLELDSQTLPKPEGIATGRTISQVYLVSRFRTRSQLGSPSAPPRRLQNSPRPACSRFTLNTSLAEHFKEGKPGSISRLPSKRFATSTHIDQLYRRFRPSLGIAWPAFGLGSFENRCMPMCIHSVTCTGQQGRSRSRPQDFSADPRQSKRNIHSTIDCTIPTEVGNTIGCSLFLDKVPLLDSGSQPHRKL